MSRSLESVLSGQRPRAHTVGAVRVDQQGRLMPSGMTAHSVVMQQDPRRFSEASIIPPPRPPPPNLKRLKPQRKPTIHAVPGTSCPPQVVLSPPAQQPQPQPQHLPQQGVGGTNLAKMAHMARSNPHLDMYTDSRERERIRDREREKSPQVQHTKDSLISQVWHRFLTDVDIFSGQNIFQCIEKQGLLLCSAQVMEAVHGVTIEEVHTALQRNDWNPLRAEQQLKVRQWNDTKTQKTPYRPVFVGAWGYFWFAKVNTVSLKSICKGMQPVFKTRILV